MFKAVKFRFLSIKDIAIQQGKKGLSHMPVIDFLERNVKLYGNETALVELNPEMKDTRRMTWKDYDLIQPTTD